MSRDADALLQLAPQNEPPIGFETRAVKLVRGIRPRAGQVFAYEGSSNWIFIVVSARSGRGVHDVVLTPRALPVSSTVGSLRIVDGRGSWGSTTGLDLRGLHVQLVDGDGKAVYEG